MKAQSIIENAAEYAGIKGFGSDLDGETLSRGLLRLNSMIDQWQADNLFIPYTTEIVQTITTSPVTIGTGQTINVTRPKFIRDTSFVRSNNTDYPIEWLTQEQYNLIVTKTQASNIPRYAYYDEAYPVGRIYFYPVPTSAELHLQVDAILPAFADYNITDYPLDRGYQLAIELSLAEMLCIGIKNAPADVLRRGAIARQQIRKNNFRPQELKLPSIVRDCRYRYFNE